MDISGTINEMSSSGILTEIGFHKKSGNENNIITAFSFHTIINSLLNIPCS